MEQFLDKITGCLVGGAVGDALGYPVEFMSMEEIRRHYGPQGIRQLDTDYRGVGVISDDTQMTLFTANGLLLGHTRSCLGQAMGAPDTYVTAAYLDWYYTQSHLGAGSGKCTWLRDLPELNVHRAPGNTCLNSLASILEHRRVNNNSSGCGGIMRVAPVALFCAAFLHRHHTRDTEGRRRAYATMAGAEVARITHLNPLGFLPAAFLSCLLYDIAIGGEPPQNVDRFLELVREIQHYLGTVQLRNDPRPIGEMYPDDLRTLNRLVDRAIDLSLGAADDEEAITQIGDGGWQGQYALAIALFCAIRHFSSLEQAVVAAVNHSGDSDSTGAITGNMMGLIYGEEAIPRQWLQHIELREVIESMARDLVNGCPLAGSGDAEEETREQRQWRLRYCEMEPCGLLSHPWYYADYLTGGQQAAITVEEIASQDAPLDMLFFWNHRSPTGEVTEACLSQWWHCRFAIDGQYYCCAEQYMMAEKARLMGDETTRRRIMQNTDPEVIKQLGREVKDFDSERWARYRYSVVLNGNLHKFAQNKPLRDFLLSTGNKVLVEASPMDKIWGIGLDENRFEARDPNLWQGSNLLGFALMQVRDALAVGIGASQM